MSKFLAGGDLSEKIKEVVAGKNVRCAVAFWGRDAVEELFGPNSVDDTGILNRDDVHVVCDLSMGGTNPETLRALGAPSNPNIRVCDGLHAKVFMSDKGAIVGSANASNNGIGFMNADAQLLEAGTFFSSKSNALSEIQRWLEDLSTEGISRQVDINALNSAQDAWSKRRRSRDESRTREQIDFLEYDAETDGLVLPCWFEGGGNQAAADDRIAGKGKSYMYFADEPCEIIGRWICAFAVNDAAGLYGTCNPYFFFVTDFEEHENNDDEFDPHLAFQSTEAELPEAPFRFNVDKFPEAFHTVAAQGKYNNLRGLTDNENWLVRDHRKLMHGFWRDVQKEYRRLQDQT